MIQKLVYVSKYEFTLLIKKKNLMIFLFKKFFLSKLSLALLFEQSVPLLH